MIEVTYFNQIKVHLRNLGTYCSGQQMKYHVPIILNICKNYLTKSVNILLGGPVHAHVWCLTESQSVFLYSLSCIVCNKMSKIMLTGVYLYWLFENIYKVRYLGRVYWKWRQNWCSNNEMKVLFGQIVKFHFAYVKSMESC